MYCPHCGRDVYVANGDAEVCPVCEADLLVASEPEPVVPAGGEEAV